MRATILCTARTYTFTRFVGRILSDLDWKSKSSVVSDGMCWPEGADVVLSSITCGDPNAEGVRVSEDPNSPHTLLSLCVCVCVCVSSHLITSLVDPAEVVGIKRNEI